MDVAEGDAEETRTGNGATLRSASPRRSSSRAASWDPFRLRTECQMAMCHLESKLGKPKERRSGCIGFAAMQAPMNCKDVSVLPSGREIDCTICGGLADAQSTPCVSVTTSFCAQPPQIREGNLEDAGRERFISSDLSGIARYGHPSRGASERRGRAAALVQGRER
jgi:hypothetical protein